MTKNKLAIIGGSGLYDVEEFKEREFLNINTPWGKPSDEILKIQGQHSNKISELLGYISKSEVVHKDDMVEI